MKKRSILLSVLFSILSLSIIVSAVKLNVTSEAATFNAGATATYGWVYERTDATVISGSNYRCVTLMVDASNAAVLGDSVWGFSVKNLFSQPATVRFGFDPVGGGKTVWLGGKDSTVFLVNSNGAVTTQVQTGSQLVTIPADFDGAVYVNLAECYNGTDDKLATNGYKAKSIIFGYDFRQKYCAKLLVTGLCTATFTKGEGDAYTMSNHEYKGGFDTLAENYPKVSYLGTFSDDAKTAADNASSLTQVKLNEGSVNWTFERTNSAKIDSSNYGLANFSMPFDKAPMFNGTEEYWGFSVKNELSSSTRIRFGFIMGGGQTCWLKSANAISYFVSNDQTIVKQIGPNGAQYLDVPASFDGVLFVKKSELINITNTTVINNKYRVKGITVGYDFRSTYAAKLIFRNLCVADFAEDGENITMSNYKIKGNLDVMDNNFPSKSNQGSLTDAVKKSMFNVMSLTSENLALATYSGIEVKNAKNVFYIGDTFAQTGLEVYGKASTDGRVKIASNYVTVNSSAVDLTKAGTYTVNVSVNEMTATYDVEVKQDVVTSIEVSNALNSFYVGDSFAQTGIKVEATWESGKKTELLSTEYTVDSQAVDFSQAGTYTVTVKYNDTITDTYDVTVSSDMITSISATITKDTYYTGTQLDLTGLVVVGTFESSAEKNLESNEYTVDSQAVDFTQAGTYTVTVKFSDEITTTFEVVVVADFVQSISLNYTTSMMFVGETVNTNDLVVSATYASEKEEELNSNQYTVDTSNVNSSTAGTYEVTVKYSDTISAILNIKVVNKTFIFYNRIVNTKVEGNTYRGARIMADSEDSQAPGEQQYIGLYVKNLLPYTNSRIRVGFTYGTKDKIIWMGGSGTYYMVNSQGVVSSDTFTGQYIFVAPNFEGWIYFDKTVMYGMDKYKGEALNGIVVGYDFRSTYSTRLGYSAIACANFTQVDTNITISNYKMLTTLSNVNLADIEKYDINGSPTQEQMDAADENLALLKIDISKFDNSNIAKIELVTNPTKVNYIMTDTALDLTDGVAEVTYTLEEGTIVARYNLPNAMFTITGFTANQAGEQEITISVGEKTAKYNILVTNEDDLIITGIAVKTNPTKVKYLVNETANWEGGVVTITYKSGKTEDVQITDTTKVTVYGFNSLSARTFKVYVRCVEDTSIMTSFDVTVEKAVKEEDKTEKKSGCNSSVGLSMLSTLAVLAFVFKKRK